MATVYLLTPGSDDDGNAWITWCEYQSGSSGPMWAYGVWKGRADANYGSPFQFVDSTGTPIAIGDQQMSNVDAGVTPDLPYTWTPVVSGNTMWSVYVNYGVLSDGWVLVT
jgi:hypothetical protein